MLVRCVDTHAFKGKARMGMECLVLAPPFLPPSSAAKPGDFGEDCLSAKREFRSRPVWRATQGTRSEAEGGGRGRLSLVTFFGRSKKATSPPGCPRQSTIRAQRTKPRHLTEGQLAP